MLIDSHAQPLAAFNAAQRTDRAVSEMLGLCKMALADGVVTAPEAELLGRWIEANPDVRESFPGATLARRLEKIFADGRIDPEEQQDLAELLSQIGGGQVCAMVGENASSTLPLDVPAPALRFTGQVYVFTGKFAFGPRSVCEGAACQLGATCEATITKRTNVLVIGSFASRDWVHTSYGRKIEKAVEYREAGRPLRIVCEDHWAGALN